MSMSGAKPQATATTTPGASNEGWPAGFWLAVLKVVLSAAVVAVLINRFERPGEQKGKKPAGSAAASTGDSPDDMPAPGFVPKLAGANANSSLPPLIYHRDEDELGKLWLRPEGGGRLRSAPTDGVIPLVEAVSYYDAQLAASPSDPGLLTMRAMIRLDLGQPAAAIHDCDAAIRQDPNRAWAYYYRGLAQLGQGDTEKALADIDRAIAIDGSLERFHWARGKVLIAAMRPADAIPPLGKAIELEPKFAAAYRDRARAWIFDGQPAEGTADVDQALRLDPRDPMNYCLRGRIRARRGDWNEALDDFKSALASNPYLAEVYFYRGGARLARKEYPEALRDLEQAIRLDPDLLFRCSFMSDDHAGVNLEEVVASFTELTRLDPRSVVARCARGSALLSLRRLAAALQDFDEALALDPNWVFARYERAAARAMQGDPRQALDDYEAARRMDPKHAKDYAGQLAEAFEVRGRTYYSRRAYRSAIADFTQAHRLDPQRESVMLFRGYSHYLLRQYDSAIDDYTESIRTCPGSRARAHFHRGVARLARRDDPREAIHDFDAAIRLQPRLVDAFIGRAQAHDRLEHYDDVIADLTRVIGLDPEDPFPHLLRGRAWIAMGRPGQAAADFARFVWKFIRYPIQERTGPRRTGTVGKDDWVLQSIPG